MTRVRVGLQLLAFIAAISLVSLPLAAQTLGMVVDDLTGDVVVFDADTNTVVGSLSTGSGSGLGALDCVVADDQSLAFVSDYSGGQVFVIDPVVPAFLGGTNPIPVSLDIEDLTLTADQQYLLGSAAGGSTKVSVVDIAARAEIDLFDLGSSVQSVEACGDASVLATGYVPGSVHRLTIDGAGNLGNTGETAALGQAFNVACGPSGGNGVTTDFSTGTLRSYGYPPLGFASSAAASGLGTVVISPDGSAAYHRSSFGGRVDGYTYDETTGAFGAAPFVSITVAPAVGYYGVDQMAIHPDGSKLYVSEGSAVKVYDAATGAPLASITDAALTSGAGVCLPRATATIPAGIDIAFCGNPNAFSCKNRGKTPATVFGTSSLDVTEVDISSLRLCLPDLSQCTSIPPAWSIADRGDPTTDLGAAACAIDPTTLEELDWLHPDGMDDLDVAFDAREIAALIGCGELDKGDTSTTLVLIGQTTDGTPITSIPRDDVGIDRLLIRRN